MKFKPLKQGKLDLFAMQEEILAYWRQENIFNRSVSNRPATNRFSFYDGPPFITGIPHYATLLPSIAKDIIPRFWTMRGKRVRRVWGWDCHGLPAETQVEKKLGIKSRREIEEMGIDKFIAACKDYVSHVSAEWRWYIDHVGRWADMDHAYRTMDQEYMETVIWIFKQLYDQDLIYAGMRSSLYCTRCATPLSKFEITMDEGFYREVEDPAVTIKFKISGQDKYLLAWTTTPWTLPGNRALAVNPVAEYVEVATKDQSVVILARQTYDHQPRSFGRVIKSLPGRELINLKYDPLFSFGPHNNNDWHVYAADFVTLEDGTGIVHVAPAFGEDDFALGQKVGLTKFVNVDNDGKFVPEVSPWQGRYIKDVAQDILDDLKQRKLLWHQATIKHAYPFCYRCATPLIYKAQQAWYLKIDNLRADLIQTNQQINWVPAHFKTGRFKYNLTNAPDWCLSRTRYWGTPVPIWRCQHCGQTQVVGSIADIEKLSGHKVNELHRPDIDRVVWTCSCGGQMRRVPEILDVWFESGSMPFAQHHYPFEHQAEFTEGFPADFVVEYTGQLRGWFYYLHVIANALRHSIAFKNVVVTGVMKGDDGRKMSKSFGNYPDPKATIKRYGGEVLRLYFMSNPIMQGEDMNVSEADIVEYYRKTMMILWNSYRYFLTYAQRHNFTPSGLNSQHSLDQWLLGQVERLAQEVEEGLENFDYVSATRGLRPFIDDLSTWYIRRSRDRFVAGDQEALSTLYQALVRLAQVAAPLLPFTTEAIYRNLVDDSIGASVHLTDWRGANHNLIAATANLVPAMAYIRVVSSLAHSIRKEAGLSLRQPLGQLRLKKPAHLQLDQQLRQLLREEVNVKQIKLVLKLNQAEGWSSKDNDLAAISLQIAVSDDLKLEGIAREIIRHGQVLRRQAGYQLDDQIQLVVVAPKNSLVRKSLQRHQATITATLQAKAIIDDQASIDAGQEIQIAGDTFFLGVIK